MDNVCHTLVGLALGEAGLRRRTPLGNATLMLGANLPDVDALAYAWSPVTALGFRRGWTHGILAMALWPFVLAGLMLALDALLRRLSTPRPPDPPTPRPVASFRSLLLLAALSIWSHPLLDLLNTYGVRLLMPFSDRWFYGDTLFIVDPWVWLMLAGGIAAAAWRGRVGGSAGRGVAATTYARVGLFATGLYIGIMAVSAAVLHRGVSLAMATHEPAPLGVMVAPIPLNPVRRAIVVELPDAYVLGSMTRRGRRQRLGAWTELAKGDGTPAARAAAATREGRTFLRWARFPFYQAGGTPEGGDCPAGHVCIRDARYFPQAWAEVAVPVGGAVSLAR